MDVGWLCTPNFCSLSGHPRTLYWDTYVRVRSEWHIRKCWSALCCFRSLLKVIQCPCNNSTDGLASDDLLLTRTSKMVSNVSYHLPCVKLRWCDNQDILKQISPNQWLTKIIDGIFFFNLKKKNWHKHNHDPAIWYRTELIWNLKNDGK